MFSILRKPLTRHCCFGCVQNAIAIVHPAFTFRRSKATEIPEKPIPTNTNFGQSPAQIPDIDLEFVSQLERISLVEMNNEEGLQALIYQVTAASQLQLIDTEGVEPLSSVLEDRELLLRDDVVTEGNCTEEILRNATKSEEQYFVAPPGNIPMKKRNKEHWQKLKQGNGSE